MGIPDALFKAMNRLVRIVRIDRALSYCLYSFRFSLIIVIVKGFNKMTRTLIIINMSDLTDIIPMDTNPMKNSIEKKRRGRLRIKERANSP